MSADPVHWIYSWPTGKSPTFRVGRDRAGLVFEWPGVASLRTNTQGTAAETVETGESEPATRERTATQARAVVSHLQGGLTLHASCVERGNLAIAFAGPSGAGKSTLAVRLCASVGAYLVADDAVVLDQQAGAVHVLPLEAHHRLRRDVAVSMGIRPSVTEKSIFPAAKIAARPSRLLAIVALSRDEQCPEPALVALKGADAFHKLEPAIVRIAHSSALRAELGLPPLSSVLRTELDQMALLLANVSIFELRRQGDERSFDRGFTLMRELLDRLLVESVNRGEP